MIRRALITGLVVLFIFGLFESWEYLHRPLFSGRFGFHPETPFASWQPSSPLVDVNRNVLWADLDWNLFVVFTAYDGTCRVGRASSQEIGIQFKGKKYTVPLERSCLVIVDENGTQTVHLTLDQIATIRSEMTRDQPNWREMLRRVGVAASSRSGSNPINPLGT
jgi:hypothetical protein